MNKEWIPVTGLNQIKQGTKLKIVGISEKNSYDSITCKKVLKMKSGEKEWVEILINKKDNLYFNLNAYLGKEKTFGKWVKELYYRQ